MGYREIQQTKSHERDVRVNGGVTKYFDFGRYDRPDIKNDSRGTDEGAVRSSKNYSQLQLPNWDFNKTNDQNVMAIMAVVQKSALFKGYGPAEGALATGLSFESMLSKAREIEAQGYTSFGGYTSGSCGNSTYCAKFVRCVGGAGGIDWDFSSFTGHQNVQDVSNDYKTRIITP